MNILIKCNSEYGWLHGSLVDHLQSYGHTVSVQEEVAGNEEYSVCFSDKLSAIQRRDLLEQLDPIRPPVKHMASDKFDVELSLLVGSIDIGIQLVGTDEKAFKNIARALSLSGVNAWQHDNCPVGGGRRLYCQNAGNPFIQVLAWLACHAGYQLAITQCDWSDVKELFGQGDYEAVVVLDDPSADERDSYARGVILELNGDDPVLLRELGDSLRECGFHNTRLSSSVVKTEESSTLNIDVTALDMLAANGARQDILTTVSEHLARWGVDEGDYPLIVESDVDSCLPGPLRVTVSLPVRAVLQGSRVPYGTISPARFSVCIKTDDPFAAEIKELEDDLSELGLYSVYVEDAGMDAEVFQRGFTIQCPKSALFIGIEKEVRSRFQAVIHALISDDGQAWQVALHLEEEGLRGESVHLHTVTLYAPIRAARQGTLLDQMKDASPYHLTLHMWFLDKKDRWEQVFDHVEEMGFGRCSVDDYHDSDRTGRIYFGGASVILIEELSSTLKMLTGQEFVAQKLWHEHDKDIWVYLPEADKVKLEQVPVAEETDHGESGEGELVCVSENNVETVYLQPAGRAFLLREAERLLVGEIELPLKAHPDVQLVPPLSMFRHYVIDRGSAHILETLAESLLLGEPVLLEGGTGTSKTSSILYLAALLGQPVVRINLNGQTDTAELVGRFQPDDGATDLPGPETLEPYTDCLTDRGRRLVERVIEHGRDFTSEERQLLKAAEGWPTRPWRWRDGLVPLAMRRGWWVILDEVNLAEPQVVERLNSVLEMPSSLVLTEHDGSALESAEGFHLFATMNPEEYAGRAALSPAFLDRWLCYLRVDGPDEVDLLAMLRCWVMGETPRVVTQGIAWDAERITPVFNHVASIPEVDTFLTALAAFHQSAVAEQDNGLEGSRRRLLAALRYLDRALALGRAPQIAVENLLSRYYLRGNKEELYLKQLAEATGLDQFLVNGDRT